jgi:hypothetical protein
MGTQLGIWAKQNTQLDGLEQGAISRQHACRPLAPSAWPGVDAAVDRVATQCRLGE